MKELQTYKFDFGEYIRMKEAGTDGFGYERYYTSPARTTRERILNYLWSRPYADNKQLSYVMKKSISTVRYHINKLQKEGVITRGWDDCRGNLWLQEGCR